VPKNVILARVSKLADIIRKKKAVSFSELCVLGKISPSTLYGYKQIILDSFDDITYEDREFRIVEK
jgi:ACT domain-containing protein